jgi:hypothetical protein
MCRATLMLLTLPRWPCWPRRPRALAPASMPKHSG